jgi:uncharacterized OB-fold protein
MSVRARLDNDKEFSSNQQKAIPLNGKHQMSSSEPQTLETGAALIAPELVEIDGQGRPRLVGGCCRRCGDVSFPRAAVCTGCLAEEIEPVSLSNRGKLYSYAVVHQAPKGWIVPYTLGYVDLPNGVRVLAHIDVPAAKIAIDMDVELSLGTVAVASDGTPRSSYVFVEADR